jgi:hypothetical protein
MEHGKKIEIAITQLLGSVCCLHRNKMDRGTIHKKTEEIVQNTVEKKLHI